MEGEVARLRARLDAGLEVMGLDLAEAQRQALIDYLLLLVRWNRAFNLTAVRDPLEMVARHLLDSLAIAPFLYGDEVLDIGTGAGLPGIPLAILAPERRFMLLDSNGKKIRFVRQAVLALGLANVTPLQARAGAYRAPRKFATIVARAVASLAELRAVAVDFMPRPARLLAMKGREPLEEMADPALAGDELIVHRLAVPFLEGDRHLIELRFH
ncbi:16S rRNA (guanine(527)-N(7))-methyltransferase GidB [Thioflavicoccus mobilis 8321]|uniref:Ribosomal RNA small subunit methyltransferase G n=1 Tax=Thioflavicoccus mobilis 8321 TaxID=765912 RepID=L0GVG9_9GAMM|nr:16S rRNA (guanine(527)-N(7))-methyltransferase RsmG [Thioflavicoccus mobilis]AGA89961.1 16S rRNA (guanine(527)-N(7))-methyltransferase GidB [Thioflavicoccus mobilis 8321]